MALFGIQMRSRRKAGIGGFHAEYLNDRDAIRHRKRMGPIRLVMSAASISFGLLMIYVGLHYIPAFTNPQKILKLSSPGMQMDRYERDSVFGPIVGPYVDNLRIQRNYMRAGQAVEVQYALPKGAKADLKIYQCRRLWVVEIFKCQVVNSETVSVGRQPSGKHRFTFKADGFYHFQEDVTRSKPGESYRVIWKRA